MSCSWEMHPIMCLEQPLSTYQGQKTFLRSCSYTMCNINQILEPLSLKHQVFPFQQQKFLFHFLNLIDYQTHIQKTDMTGHLNSQAPIGILVQKHLQVFWKHFSLDQAKTQTRTLMNPILAQPHSVSFKYLLYFHVKPVYSFKAQPVFFLY